MEPKSSSFSDEIASRDSVTHCLQTNENVYPTNCSSVKKENPQPSENEPTSAKPKIFTTASVQDEFQDDQEIKYTDFSTSFNANEKSSFISKPSFVRFTDSKEKSMENTKDFINSTEQIFNRPKIETSSRTSKASKDFNPFRVSYDVPVDMKVAYRQPNMSDLRAVIRQDINDANLLSQIRVEQTKENINSIGRYFTADHEDENQYKSEKLIDSIEETREMTMNKILETSFDLLEDKGKTDLQVARILDKIMVDETKTEVINKNLSNCKNKIIADLTKAKEDTVETVQDAKVVIEHFAADVARKHILQEEMESEHVLQHVLGKARLDFMDSNRMSQRQADYAMSDIRNQLGVFMTNPTGRKSREELESEAALKKQLTETVMELDAQFRADLTAAKTETGRTVVETKEKIGNLMLKLIKTQGKDSDIKGPFDQLKYVFQQADTKVKDDVACFKSKLASDAASIANLGENDGTLEKLNNLREKAKNNFKETQEKFDEDVTDFKTKFSHNLPISHSSQKSDDVNQMIQRNLDEFQAIAKRDFQNTDVKMQGSIEDMKSTVEESIKNIKSKFLGE